ncbi:MAG: class I SAM-dependent methyltransferase [Magnetococcales bacterium]|nr:class I SAM-dependent methyltransferase [Magnetococcales bacterium]
MRVFDTFVKDRSLRILDVGCGNGTFLHHLHQSGFHHIAGIEPHETLLYDLARRHPELNGKVVPGTASPLPFTDHSFDCIYFFNVLHHLTGPREYDRAFDEVLRCLSPGGQVIFVEPCRKWIYASKRWMAGRLGRFFPFFRQMHAFMMEERDLMNQFMDHQSYIRNALRQRELERVHDQQFLHQWTVVARKRPGHANRD